MKKRNLLLILSSFFVVVSSCKKEADTPTNTNPKIITETYLDTLFDYHERSADGVYHVANNSSRPVYERYFFGTNQNWTDIAQHFNPPKLRNSQPAAEVSKVELNGFRLRIAVMQDMGTRDSVLYEIYTANADKNPTGSPLATGKFLPGNPGFQDVPFTTPVDVNSSNGFLISFHTYDMGSDIFVLSNSYCVVNNGANDGRGERRTRVKLTNGGNWSDLLENGPSANQDPGEDPWLLDCDMYVFPMLEVTEQYPE